MAISVSRIKLLWSWLFEARFAWLALGVIFFALMACFLNTSEPTIRITGLSLQLLGISTVIWGISETEALFGNQSLLFKVKSWCGRFPLLRSNVVASGDMASLSLGTCNAKAYGTHGTSPNPTTENRLDALEKNISLIHERINGTENEMDEAFRKIKDVLKVEVQTREIEDSSILGKLEATGLGGVHISLIGALWLFVGVILSTAAIEIARLLG